MLYNDKTARKIVLRAVAMLRKNIKISVLMVMTVS